MLKTYQAWLVAIRLRTLGVSLSPVCVAAGLVWHRHHTILPLPLLATVMAALFIQIAANLFNDAADFERGVDGPNRLGPPRVCATGLLSPWAVRFGGWGCVAGAGLCGLYLAWLGGWPILLLGGLSLAAAWGYSGGKHPISHGPFGEILVIGFFGVAAVMGTAWLQGASVDLVELCVGFAVGSFAAAVLLTNNHRDAAEDALHGRRTLAIRLGGKWVGRLYAALLIAPYGVLIVLHYLLPQADVWMPVLSLPMAWSMGQAFPRCQGHELNIMLGRCGLLQAAYSGLLFLGLVTS